MASDVAISSRHWARCNKGGTSSSGLIHCSLSEDHSLDEVKRGSYAICLISDWGLQRRLDKFTWLCVQKAKKERDILRKGRENGCRDKRGTREKKKRTEKMKTEVLEMLSSISVGFALVSTFPSESSSLLLQSSPGLTVLQGPTAWAGWFRVESSLCSDLPQSIFASALVPEEWCFPPDIENSINIRGLGLRRRAGHVTVIQCP